MSNLYSNSGPHTTWSSQRQDELTQPSTGRQLFGWATGAAVGAGVFGVGMLRHGGERGFTKAYRTLQVAERFVLPGGMMATFRLPFMVSPFVDHERIMEATGKLFKPFLPPEAFNIDGGNKFIREVMASVMGVEPHKLIDAGQHGLRLERESADSVFYKAYNAKSGELVQDRLVLGQRGRARELQRMIQADLAIKNPDLLARVQADWERQKYGSGEASSKAYSHKTAPSLVATAGQEMKISKVRAGIGYHVGSAMEDDAIKAVGRNLEFLPIHIPTVTGAGPADTAIHMGRLVGAAGSGRLNELIRTIWQQIPILSDIGGQLPFKLYGKEGSFLKNSFMYARKAGTVGMAGLLLSSASWAKQHDTVGGAAAFGITGAYFGSIFGKKWSHIGRGAAIGAVGSLLPPFRDGLFAGFGNVGAIANKLRSTVTNALSPVPFIGSGWRRWFETNMPGSTDSSTAIGMGIIGVGVGHVLDRMLRKEMRPSMKGGTILQRIHASTGTYATQFWNIYNERGLVNESKKSGGAVLSKGQQRMRDSVYAINEISKRSAWRHSVTEGIQGGEIPKWMTKQINHDISWATRIVGEENPWKRMGLQVQAAWAGANPKRVIARSELGDKFWRAGGIKNIKQWSLPFGSSWGMRFVTAAAAWSVLAGKLATSETTEELSAIYEGRKLQPVRKGRWWEGGGTAWEGGAISHFKPHWLALSKSRAIEKSVWGEDEDFDFWNPVGGAWHSPIGKFYRKHFTYELEERNYKDRPYPITGQAFEEVPFAKLFLDPIGKLIKPARLMHVGEWARVNRETGSLELKHISNSLEIQPAYSLGGLQPGTPDSPYSGKRRLGQFFYQNLVEGPGLWGFTLGEVGKHLAGVDVPGTQGSQLQSANAIDSWTRRYWEQNLGGFGFLSEPIRRFFPRPLSSIQQYNPIPNNMPSWMPEELRFGDPYSNVAGGEYRLPGKGYAALHPELEGKDPESWPLVYKYAVLGDVAAWSQEFREVQRAVKFRTAQGQFGEEALKFVQAAESRMQQKRAKREWQSYLPALNENTKRRGLVGRAAGMAWKGFNEVIHDVFSGPSKIIPLGFRPVEKLFKYLDPISEYEDTVVYGTRFAFWGLKEMWRDWFRPFINQTLHDWFGVDAIPGHIKTIRGFNDHYDKLEYYKWKMLEEQAHEAGDTRNASLYEKLASKTVTGVNPFDRLAAVKAALPREEQDFFEAFASTTSERRRKEILDLVPESLHRIYEAQWLKADYLRTGDEKLGRLVQDWGSTAGEDFSTARYSRYEKEAPSWMSFGDFEKLQRTEAELGDTMPAVDWVGFNPAVDLEDVKLRVVQQQGKDIHDYGMWESQSRLLSRKPYLTDEVIAQGNYFEPTNDRDLGHLAFGANGFSSTNMRTISYSSANPSHTLDLEVNDSRMGEEDQFRKRYGL